jgi:hypothetical protein
MTTWKTAMLHLPIRRTRRRLLGIATAAAVAWGLAAATMLLLVAAWLDLLWELPTRWRIAALWTAGGCGAGLLLVLAFTALRAARAAAIARRLDRAGRSGGRILTGWELAQGRYGLRGARPAPITAGLAQLAVADAASAAARVPLALAAPWRPLGRSLAALACLWAAVAAVAIALPGLSSAEWNRLLRPRAEVPPFSWTKFAVSPGDVKVLYGSELEIRATVSGAPVEQLELVLQPQAASTAAAEPPLPMFPEGGGTWRAVLAKVVEPGDYYVRAGRARSAKYHISIITVPLVESARVRIVPPEYANWPTYEGPLPKEGVSGLRGTKVEVFLHSNRPLSGGSIALSMSGHNATLPMHAIEPGSQEAMGQFSLAGDGKFECRVSDLAGQASQQSLAGTVVTLADRRPFLRITEPQKTSLATPTAMVPVTLSAEDDCGISRLELFRSLNDSRPLPVALALPPRAPRRWDATVRLPLEQYGLEPGDVIKLFGRVEDNDPAGRKGAESSVVMVRIVSQEEFDKMIRVREGIQSLISKYNAARRRMESLAQKSDGLRKKLKNRPGDEKLSEEIRRELRRLEEAMRNEAEEIRRSADHRLPFDLDKNLTPQLEVLSRDANELADMLAELQKDKNSSNAKLLKKLDEMARRLDSSRKLYHEHAALPLEHLAAIFPLMADQNRFVMLVQWQEDLAQRMAALKEGGDADDPARRARMRDLEQEQRQVRETLSALLDDIQDHAERLPDKPELKQLREKAQKFVKDLRASGASEAMSAAEEALEDFRAGRARAKSQEAADILRKFIKSCQSTGNMASMCLTFQPTLCANVGNTIAQLLAGVGLGNGSGGGYGMVGLYGGMPSMLGRNGEIGDGRQGHGEQEAGAGAAPHGDNPDRAQPGDVFVPGAAGGAAEGGVPLRYRRQVGEYFQRIIEETEGSGR